jgi:phage protein D
MGVALFDNLAPAFDLEVDDFAVGESILRSIQRVEFESADGAADMLKIKASNPDFEHSSAKVFMPGGEVAVWFGYGASLNFVGRAVITKVNPTFPQGEIPILDITAYSKDVKMMDNAPEGSKKKGGKGGRVWGGGDVKHSDVVEDRAGDYEFETDVDPTPVSESTLIQKAGLTDYQLVQGLANLNGFIFWVDADERGKWTLHFKDPGNVKQDKEYTLVYSNGDDSSLYEFSPEFLTRGAVTKFKVQYRNVATGKLMEEEIEEDLDSPDTSYTGDPTAKVVDEFTSPAALKVFVGDFAFDIASSKPFKSDAEIKAYAAAWFRRMKESFIIGGGKTVGIEALRARQVHKIEGVGPPYEGKYYFAIVRHVFDASSGYTCEFEARKVI